MTVSSVARSFLGGGGGNHSQVARGLEGDEPAPAILPIVSPSSSRPSPPPPLNPQSVVLLVVVVVQLHALVLAVHARV